MECSALWPDDDMYTIFSKGEKAIEKWNNMDELQVDCAIGVRLQGAMHCMNTFMWHFEEDKTIET
jgi:hypothetical protein